MKPEPALKSDLSAEEEELLRYLAEIEADQAGSEAPALVRRPAGTDAPLSFGQQRLWVLDQIEGSNQALHLFMGLRLRGPLDREALAATLDAIVARHEVLRTYFVAEDPEPVQRVVPELSLKLPVTDLGDAAADRQPALLADAMRSLMRTPFDLGSAPLLRASLLQLGPEEHSLMLVLHHSVGDRWSLALLFSEIVQTYAALSARRPSPLPALTVQYGDYASWERERLRGARLDRLLAYWRGQLGGVETLELPLDRPRPAVQTFVGASEAVVVPRAVLESLERIARASGATRFMALLAVFAAVLQRYSGQTDIVVGTPISNRNVPELEQLVGFFLNTLVLRLDAAGDPTFAELLERVRRTTLDAYAHQALPFERIVQELNPRRDLSRSPLFQVLFVQLDQVQSAPGKAGPAALAIPSGSITVGPETFGRGAQEPLRDDLIESTQYDLEVYVGESVDGLNVRFIYNVDLFEAHTVRRMVGHFREVLERAVQSTHRTLSELTVLGPAERDRLLCDWNATAREFPAESVPALFFAQAARSPQAVAVQVADSALTYAELARRVAAVASRLSALGVRAGDRVGVCVERALELPVAMLGAMASGAAYVPLDPAFPDERLRYMADDAGVAVVMTQGRLPRQWPGRVTLDVDADGAALAENLDAHAMPAVGPRDLAYVIYTSGSTGWPKGVCIEHDALANFLWSMRERPGLEPADVLVSVTTSSFDIFGLELFLPLLTGARLVIASREEAMDGAALARLLDSSAATVLQATPATWRMLLESSWRGRKSLKALCGGESLPPALATQLVARVGSLWNMYGPTETTIWSTVEQVGEGSIASSVCIGRPIGNTRVYVLDGNMQPVPVGVSGELWIGGAGVARGYWERPELTAERFVTDPFAEEAGARMYRTGDLARWRGDGRLEHLGRLDHQVKLRGYRIEPGEVEAVLEAHEGVAQAVVVTREVSGEARLVAYVVGELHEPRVLDAYARARLPGYMVPGAWRFLDALPLTPNGKVDRRALPEPEVIGLGARQYVAPRSRTERIVADIWCQVLGVERVAVHDGFFDLGGHSLQLMAVRARLEAALGCSVAVTDLFRYPTVEALARFFEGDRTQETPVLEAARSRVALRRARVPEHEGIAVIAMAGRFPGAPDSDAYWRNLAAGVESIRFFDQAELKAAGFDAALLADPRFVPARGALDDVELFDAEFFGYSPREAELLDPQQRIFLECAWEALERAGYDPLRVEGPVGVYAGAATNQYLFELLARPDVVGVAGGQALMGSESDFLPMRVSYKLNLRGPSVNVQTTCSTSLVAVHQACSALNDFECDVALAGGVTTVAPRASGYLYQEGGIVSPDGHCRPFDARARGTVFGEGVGVVVLKRLSDALAAGDRIRAVIRGTAVNNDGADKVGFTAPSVNAQAQLVAAAHAVAGVSASTIGYLEAHGTGTALGDPIELAALRLAFAGAPERHCAIGSVKANIGHLDRAAGIAGLIKSVLMLERGLIPPAVNCETPHPEIATSPFFVNPRLASWERFDGAPRRAGVSSFGMGGTNAHAVLEEAPAAEPSGPSRPYQLLLLSARSNAALQAASQRLADHLETHADSNLADVAHTLRTGRTPFAHRRALVCRSIEEAVAALRTSGSMSGVVAAGGRPASIAFIFPGQGTQHPNMGRALYEREPAYRQVIDECCERLRARLGVELREVLFPTRGEDEAAQRLQRTGLAQPALFATEYALAQLLMAWGIRPAAMIGHSIGELVAACVSGVVTLADALALVAERGRLMETAPEGAMLAVMLTREAAAAYAGEGVWLAAVNAESACVLSCSAAAAAPLQARLDRERVEYRRLHTSHAFHCGLMQPAMAPLQAFASELRIGTLGVPYVSNVSGTWMEPAMLADGSYWSRHLREPVQFQAGIERLLAEVEPAILLEVGPGRALSQLVRATAARGGARVVTTLGSRTDDGAADACVTHALGELWVCGAAIDWTAYVSGERRCKAELPPYPFQRKRFSVIRERVAATNLAPDKEPVRRKADMADWFSAPAWQRTLVSTAAAGGKRLPGSESWLILADAYGLGRALAQRLRAEGQRVAVVEAGSAYSAAAGEYTLMPTRPEHYDALFDHLEAHAGTPQRVVYMGSLTGCAQPDAEVLVERCFHAPVRLVQCLGKRAFARELRFFIVSDGLHEVTGSETICPEKSLLLGPCRVAPLEYPGMVCRSVDLEPWSADPGAEQAVLETLLGELRRDERTEPVVAFRNGYRWLPQLAPVRLGPVTGRPAQLREGGVYLITGGLGGIGLALADYLAETVRAQLILVGRSGLPPEAQWEGYLAGHQRSDPTARRILAVRALRAKGARVRVEAANVADRQQMERLVQRIRIEFGCVHGVIHAAGQAGAGLIQLKTREEAEAVLEPKVAGTRLLAELLQQPAPDFMLLCSSINALLGMPGQVDYTAANAYLDAFALRQRKASSSYTVSVNWDAWREVGMAAETSVPGMLARQRAETLADAIGNHEGSEAFARVLSSALPQVLVSPRLWERSATAEDRPAAHARAAESGYERPDLDVDYVAPRDETETSIARMWSELLGIERIGVNDDFLDLGGHSLLATRLLARLRIEFDADHLALEEILAEPTVASIARRIRAGGGPPRKTADAATDRPARGAAESSVAADRAASDLLSRVYAASKDKTLTRQ